MQAENRIDCSLDNDVYSPKIRSGPERSFGGGNFWEDSYNVKLKFLRKVRVKNVK